MATEWQILDRVWDLPDRNKIKSDALRKVLREMHTGSGKAGFEVITGPVARTTPLVVDEGRTVVVDGDLSIGTSGTPLTVDQTHLAIEEGGLLVVLGNIEVYRNVSAASILVDFGTGALSCTGTCAISHAGGGNNVGTLLDEGSQVAITGLTTITTDATGAAAVALQGSSQASAAFQGGLTIVASGADVKPLNFSGDVSVVIGDTIVASGNLSLTRSGAGNVWTQNVLSAGSKLTVGGDITLTANAITANEVLFFIDASDIVCSGDVTLNATSLADGAIQLYNGGTFRNNHNVKTMSISLGNTAVEAIKVIRGSKFTMANDIILEGTAAAVMLDAGSKMNVGGDLLLGNTTEQPNDLACVSVLGGSKATIAGALTTKREVSGGTSTPLVHVRGAGSSLNVAGATLLDEDSTTGTVASFSVEEGAFVAFQGTSTFNSTLPNHVILLTGGSVVNFVGAYVLSQDAALSVNCGLLVHGQALAVFGAGVTSTIIGGDAYWGGHLYAIEAGRIEVESTTGSPQSVTLSHPAVDIPGIVAYASGKVNIEDSAVISISGGKAGGWQPSIWATQGGSMDFNAAIPTLVQNNTAASAFQVDFNGKMYVAGSVGGTNFTAASSSQPAFQVNANGELLLGQSVTLADHSGDDPDIRLSQHSKMVVGGSFTTTTSATTGVQVDLIEDSHLFIDDNMSIIDGSLRMDGSCSCVIGGNLIAGDTGSEITNDVVVLDLSEDSKLNVGGNCTSYRDVSSANPQIKLRGSAKIDIAGNCTLSRTSAGAGGVVDMDDAARFQVGGTTDLLAHGGAIAADGSFVRAGGMSKALFNRVLFSTGGNLDLGAYASVLMEKGSQLVVTDAAGASDALNSDGGAGARGIKLTGGSQAHVPAWTANTGIGVSGAGSGFDAEVGGTAAADYTGSEILVDIGAATPELCLLNKP
jgi:hypothetical protein